MARVTKQGVDYFPMDVHTDDKFKFIEIKFKLEGFAVVVKLFQRIYAQGYWCEWGEDEVLIFAHEIGTSTELLNEIVTEALKRDIFCEQMYDEYKILTSQGIQKRYKEIVKRRKGVEIATSYLLVDDDFGVNDNTMYTRCKHDVSKSTQSKVKESKVKESNIDTNVSKSIDEQSTQANLNYEEIINFFNTKTNGVFGLVRYPISDKRKGMLRARIREHGKQAFEEVVLKAASSEFLKGNNSRGFQATFDWIIKPNNFQKTLEGNYDNRENLKYEKNRTDTETARREQQIIKLAREAGMVE